MAGQASKTQVPVTNQPASREGVRSPSQLSSEYAYSERSHRSSSPLSSEYSHSERSHRGLSSRYQKTPEQIQVDRERTKKDIKQGATKGLLGQGRLRASWKRWRVWIFERLCYDQMF